MYEHTHTYTRNHLARRLDNDDSPVFVFVCQSDACGWADSNSSHSTRKRTHTRAHTFLYLFSFYLSQFVGGAFENIHTHIQTHTQRRQTESPHQHACPHTITYMYDCLCVCACPFVHTALYTANHCIEYSSLSVSSSSLSLSVCALCTHMRNIHTRLSRRI